MNLESNPSKTKVCPTCGTRLSENAARCLVCGAEFAAKPEPKAVKKVEKSVQASRMPVVTLSLPVAVGILIVVVTLAAVITFISARATAGDNSFESAETPTSTEPPTITPTVTATFVPTDVPTATNIPPFEYTVAEGDGTCGFIAAQFKISVQSIIIENNLPASCPISVGQVLKIPYPTATPLPPPTNTLLPENATEDTCEKAIITVQDGDTLSTIAANYNVPAEEIKRFNGKTTDNVYVGENLKIPLCMRAADPNRPTHTPTIPPPYPAPNLLLPADGADFTLANDVVTLQWASVGTLRDTEAYQITVVDVSATQTHRLTDYVTDTKYIVPTSFRPKDNRAHILRWWVIPVRQSGTDDQGKAVWVKAGAESNKYDFTWVGIAIEGTPNP